MESLILKYLTDEISPSELEELRQWLKKDKNKKTFASYIEDSYLLNKSVDAIDLKQSYNKLWQKIQKEQKPVRRLFSRKFNYIAAASAALLFGLAGYLYFQKATLNDAIIKVSDNAIKAGTDKAFLTTEDGSIIELEKGKVYKTGSLQSNGEELVYAEGIAVAHVKKYNYLTIPRGGQFFLKLADGTKVWLNSESKLKYPVLFAKGESRNVELLYGEAYFEVSPSSMHSGSRFKVLNENQEIEVLGTEFNVKAYRHEKKIYTTLVKGRIALKTGSLTNLLMPNRQAVLDLNSNKVELSEVDVYNDTSWKEGVFSFDGKTMKDITDVLSRWYDVDFIYADKELENATFNGALRKDQNIESVLETIKSFGVIKQYKIKNKSIELK